MFFGSGGTEASPTRKLNGVLPSTIPREAGANGFDNLSSRWHDAERCESAAIDHGLTIYQYRVLAIAPVNHLDIDPQVTS